ncbi:hypothetical protein AB433_05935 [Croceicoccus naphthovorans]|uniref:Fe/B12 periplasmic-binding domain-containing protein n=2 Tax=Croceicoccus naphthovorans TaxID=1348774 RepID=A0A0G3XLT7_9SPHN|nr:hypothetical protein AB433_05935 [Croceicoccus naphthovorans]
MPAEGPHPKETGIVSLNPCADAILAEVAPERLMAVSHYSHDPDSASMDVALARRFPATSGAAEEIAALAPDVVVAGTFLPPATEQALRRMGLRVVKIGSIASVEDARAQVRELAALAGRQDAGEALVARIDAALADAAPDPSGPEKPVPALIWQAGGLVPGEATLVSDLLAHTGFTNFSVGRGLGQGAVVPLEDVLADPPSVVLNAGAGRMQSHPALAVLADRTEPFDTRLTWCGGPTIPQAAGRLAEIWRELR